MFEITEALDMLQFFGGQRAGRELWADKSTDVQNADIESFNEKIKAIRALIQQLEAQNAEKDARIQQLEAELEDMTARYKIADDCAKKKGEMNEKLYAELAAVKAEQDATMNFLHSVGCETCVYEECDGYEHPCIDCTAERDLWQWKGVQKED